MKQIIAVLAVLIVLGYSQTATADNGMCPAFAAADIDAAFATWSNANDFDPGMDRIDCLDDRSIPLTAMEFRIGFVDAIFSVIVDPEPSGPSGSVACSFRNISGEFSICEGTVIVATRDLDTGEKHICRAEVLRSFTWRQYCSQIVDRSQAP